MSVDHDLQSAANEFNAALNADHQPGWTVVWSHINLGLIFDIQNGPDSGPSPARLKINGLPFESGYLPAARDRAISQYQAALETGDDTFGALEVAKAYIDKAASPHELIPQLPHRLDNLIDPKILSRVDPVYTPEALLARLEGTIEIKVSVNPDATVSDLKITKSLGLGLDEAALTAVRQWKFAPATLDNQPVAGAIAVTLRLQLPEPTPGWHVTKIEFTPPDSGTRPVLSSSARFTPGKMTSGLAEEAMLDAAMNRFPTASLALEIDPNGQPANVRAAADDKTLSMWADDAIRTVTEWRFTPGATADKPVSTPCTLELTWFPPQVHQ